MTLPTGAFLYVALCPLLLSSFSSPCLHYYFSFSLLVRISADLQARPPARPLESRHFRWSRQQSALPRGHRPLPRTACRLSHGQITTPISLAWWVGNVGLRRATRTDVYSILYIMISMPRCLRLPSTTNVHLHTSSSQSNSSPYRDGGLIRTKRAVLAHAKPSAPSDDDAIITY